MTKEQNEKITELTERADNCGFGYSNITIDAVDCGDNDYFVNSVNPHEETVDLESGLDEQQILGFPLKALSEDIIDEVLDALEAVIEEDEISTEKVFDRNHWANI